MDRNLALHAQAPDHASSTNDQYIADASSEDIYSVATQCKGHFEDYLQHHRVHHNRVSQLQQRFLIWSSYLGAFADEKACLDQRLRQSPEIKELVMLMLRVLRRNLIYAIDAHDLGDLTEKEPVPLDDRDSAIYGLNGAMERLHRLATIIRGGPRDDEIKVVRRFASRLEPDGFYDVVLALIRFHFEKASKKLHTQLAQTVVYRRHRLLYNLKHQQKLSRSREDTQEATPTAQKGMYAQPGQLQPDPVHIKTTTSHGKASGGTLNTHMYTQPSQRFINDRVMAIRMIHGNDTARQEDSDTVRSANPPPSGFYPDPPKSLNQYTPVACPYCHCELENSVLTSKRLWGMHFDADLRPYACISEECGDLPPTFSSTREWLSHMGENHGPRWAQHVHRAQWVCLYCPNDSNGRLSFPTRDLLLHHLTRREGKHHLLNLDPLKLSAIKAESLRLEPAAANECPLCSNVPEVSAGINATKALHKHLAEHMVYIARLSLHWWKVDSKEDTKEGEDYLTGDNVTYSSIDPFRETWENSEETFLGETASMDDQKPVQGLSSEVYSDYTPLPDSELDLRQMVPLEDFEIDWQELSRGLGKPEVSFERLNMLLSRMQRTFGECRERLRKSTLNIRNDEDDITYSWIPVSRIYQIIQDPANEFAEALKTEGLDAKGNMVRYVSQEARRLVALLIRRDHLKWLNFFYVNNLGDEYFPITFQSVSIDESSQKWTLEPCNRSNKSVSFEVTKKNVHGFSEHDEDKLQDFCKHYQWDVFVPVFSPHERVHVLDTRCQMPFIKEFESHITYLSIVRHFVIHQSHLNFPRDDQIGTIVDEDDNPHIAVKEILSAQGLTADKFQELAKNEATILTRLRGQNHPHFIRTIASYTQGNRHFFIFPWARGGNLRDFWKLQPSLSTASDDTSTQDWNNYLEWFFEQLLGLASAIKNLHYPRGDPNESCRHGNLKPENILCFSKNEDDIGKGRIPTGVQLVVGDSGHAKVPEMTTEFQDSPMAISRGRLMYWPPEADLEQARTRRYDIWSLGCLYLDSLIWMMYGYDALKSFHEDVGHGEPYFVKDQPFDLKDAVKEWIKAVKTDPRCAPVEKTAVGRLATLIEERMLIPLVSIKETDLKQLASLDIHMIVQKPTLPPDSPGFANENLGRADAKEVDEEMKKIIDAGRQSLDFTWMIRDAEAAARGSPNIAIRLAAGNNRRRSRSHDPYEYETDISEISL